MLRALDIDEPGGGNLGAFWHTFILGLVQAFFVQDPIKVRRLCKQITRVPPPH